MREVEESLRDAGGTAARIAGIQLDILAGDWIKLKSVISSVAISINNSIGPALRVLAQRLREIILSRQTDLLAWIEDLAGKIALWIERAGGIEGALRKLRTTLTSMFEIAKKVFFVILGFKAIAIATSAIAAMSAAVTILASSFGQVAIAAAIAFIAVQRFQDQAAKVEALDEELAKRGIEDQGQNEAGPLLLQQLNKFINKLGSALVLEDVDKMINTPVVPGGKSLLQREQDIERNRILQDMLSEIKQNNEPAYAE